MGKPAEAQTTETADLTLCEIGENKSQLVGSYRFLLPPRVIGQTRHLPTTGFPLYADLGKLNHKELISGQILTLETGTPTTEW
jgi:hypothetical protein